MPIHTQHVPADKKDREKFSRDWKEDRKFKEAEKKRRFAAIKDRRKNKDADSCGINIDVSSD